MKTLLWIGLGGFIVYVALKNQQTTQSLATQAGGAAEGAKIGGAVGQTVSGATSIWQDITSLFGGGSSVIPGA